MLKPHIIDEIHAIRKTLESFGKSDFHSNSSFYHSSKGFPTGCCGDTTNLLGLYLKQKYDISTEYVSATGLGDNLGQSHAWLKIDSFTVDITADQFNEKGYTVGYVIIMEDSHFHTLFDDIDSYALNTETLKGTAVESVLYKVINTMKSSEKRYNKAFKRN